MKKILNNKDLLEQFKSDKTLMTYQDLANKYSISKSSVNRIINQIKSQNSSLNQSINQSQISEQIQQEESQETQNSEQEEIEETQISEQSITEKSADESQQEIQSSQQSEQEIQNQQLNNSLIDYLNEQPKINDSVEIQRNKKEKVQIQKPIIQQQPTPTIYVKKQEIQQIELKDQGEQDSEIKNLMVKIRKFIQFFPKEESIFHIVGSNEFQQRQFSQKLYLKNLEELKLIHKSIEFELLFSRSNSFIQDSIESTAIFIERLLLVIDVNVVGVYQELKQDEEFQFYMNMLLCENSYVASAKQILFLKFIKNYYKKYSERGKTTVDNKQVLKEKENADLLAKFNKL